MKKLLLISLLSISTTAFASDSKASNVITLTSSNHVSLIGEVNDESITEIILKASKIKDPTVYVYIDSPGGDVMAGIKFIQYMRTSDKKFVCLANVAISMAHQILQNCTERVGTPNNLLMQHRMTFNYQGNADQIANFVKALRLVEIQLNEVSAKRIGISLAEFFKRVSTDWWTSGRESKKQNLIDSIFEVKCEESLYAIDTPKVVRTLMGNIPTLINGCPLVPVRADSTKMRNLSPEEKERLDEMLNPKRTKSDAV